MDFFRLGGGIHTFDQKSGRWNSPSDQLWACVSYEEWEKKGLTALLGFGKRKKGLKEDWILEHTDSNRELNPHR